MASSSFWVVVAGWVWRGIALAAAMLLPLGAGPERAATEILRPSAQRNGLLQQVVYCLERDRLGRVWAGTRNGPFVYNGRRWTPIALPPAAPSVQVRAILQTQDGSLWFGTQEGGLWRQKQGGWTHFDAKSGLPADRVNALVEWGPGPGGPALWVGTVGGVARFQDGKWTSASQGLPSPWTWKFRVLAGQAQAGGLWVATQKGLARWEGAQWVPLAGAVPAPETNDFLEVQETPGHSFLWVSFWNLGIGRFDGQAWQVFGPAQGFPSTFPTILTALPGPQGTQVVGAGSYDRGLAFYRQGTWQVLNAEKGLPHDGVFSFLWDPGGGHPFLWVGTRGGGITTLGLGDSARVLDVHGGLPANDVQALLVTPAEEWGETYWFGTAKGLARWRDSRWQVYTRNQGLPAASVTALSRSSDGKLWIGTEAGVAVLQPDAPQATPLPGWKEAVSALATEGPRVWIGTKKGLWRWERGVLTHEQGAPGAVEVLALAQGGSGEAASVWVGTRGNGLLQKVKGQWRRHDPNPNFPRSTFACLWAETGPQGQEWLWAGTLGNGITRLDLARPGEGWKGYSTRSPVPLVENMARALTRDSAGLLYIGTSYGLTRVRFDATGTTIQEVEALGPSEGLPPSPCLRGAALTDGQGQVWFGFPEGAVTLRPKPAEPNATTPAPVLERVLLFGKDFELSPEASLSHRQNHLAFEFFLPWFWREEAIFFRSQLLGLEEEPTPWVLDNRREFPALGAGRYLLRIWAKDHLGRDSQPLDIRFRIRPAPWFHPLALAAYGLGLAGVLVAFIRLRTRYLRRRNERLEAAVAEATADLRVANQRLHEVNEEKNQFLGIAAHDLKNPLNGILLMMEVLEGEDDLQEIETIRAKVHKAARRMADLIGNLLNVNALESGHRQMPHRPVDLRTLAAEAAQEYQPTATAKGLRIRVEDDGTPCVGMGDAATLREVASNLVSNALKFMPAGPPERPVNIRTGEAGLRVFLEVQDEGPGFTAADQKKAFGRFVRLSAQPTSGENSTGLGLAIVKQLVEAMGGTVTLESEAGHGATLRVLLARAPEEGEGSLPPGISNSKEIVNPNQP